ncbi:pectinesterase inhibitor-like [Quercus robur]|uniref:pectinesterase inhibitor-like n=1 Tax=Quercus robur TaxID=38942 RepID=UPI002161D08C|nr:pectinesterase inhibitor-like [Quercus robur]
MKQTVPSFSASCLFISLLLAITLSCISPAQSIGQDVLNDICSKSKDSSFCLKSLNSDPQTATTDLLGLAGISIKLAKTTVDATYNFVKSQVGLVTDPTLKKQYTQCVESYDDANDKVDYANERLKAGDYGGVGVATSACLDDVSDCENPPPVAVNVAAASTLSLSEQNKESYELCQIALIISNRLSGKN